MKIRPPRVELFHVCRQVTTALSSNTYEDTTKC